MGLRGLYMERRDAETQRKILLATDSCVPMVASGKAEFTDSH